MNIEPIYSLFYWFIGRSFFQAKWVSTVGTLFWINSGKGESGVRITTICKKFPWVFLWETVFCVKMTLWWHCFDNDSVLCLNVCFLWLTCENGGLSFDFIRKFYVSGLPNRVLYVFFVWIA